MKQVSRMPFDFQQGTVDHGTVHIRVPVYLTILQNLCRSRNKVTRRKIKKSCHLSFPLLISSILKHHSSSSNIRQRGLTMKLLCFLLVLYGFLIGFYFCSMIKTEMVVQEAPIVIQTYADILSRPEIRPYWYTAHKIHEQFRSADPESKAGKIWAKAKFMNLSSSLLVKGTPQTSVRHPRRMFI